MPQPPEPSCPLTPALGTAVVLREPSLSPPSLFFLSADLAVSLLCSPGMSELSLGSSPCSSFSPAPLTGIQVPSAAHSAFFPRLGARGPLPQFTALSYAGNSSQAGSGRTTDINLSNAWCQGLAPEGIPDIHCLTSDKAFYTFFCIFILSDEGQCSIFCGYIWALYSPVCLC